LKLSKDDKLIHVYPKSNKYQIKTISECYRPYFPAVIETNIIQLLDDPIFNKTKHNILKFSIIECTGYHANLKQKEISHIFY